MNDITRRHSHLKQPNPNGPSYGELAAFHLRRIIYELGTQLQSPAPLDVAALQQRTIFALTLLEAHDPGIVRYEIGVDMPYAGRIDDEGVQEAE